MKTLYISDLDGTLMRNNERLSEYTGTRVPSQILALKTKPVLHNRFARKGELGDIALKFAGGLNGRG